MEIVSKILIMRPPHPTSLIIKKVFDIYNNMEQDMLKMFYTEPKGFNWSRYIQAFPIYNMYFGTDYVVNSYINSFFNNTYKQPDLSLIPPDWRLEKLHIPPKSF